MGRANSRPVALMCTKYLTLCRFEMKKRKEKQQLCCSIVRDSGWNEMKLRRRRTAGGLSRPDPVRILHLALWYLPLQLACKEICCVNVNEWGWRLRTGTATWSTRSGRVRVGFICEGVEPSLRSSRGLFFLVPSASQGVYFFFLCQENRTMAATDQSVLSAHEMSLI